MTHLKTLYLPSEQYVELENIKHLTFLDTLLIPDIMNENFGNELRHLTNLTHLEIEDNQISTHDLMFLTNLEYLYYDDNYVDITKTELSELLSLE